MNKKEKEMGIELEDKILESDEEDNKGILELLIYSQLFIYEISKLLKKDLSNPDYSEDSMKIYRYNKEII